MPAFATALAPVVEQAIALGDTEATVNRIKDELALAVREGRLELPPQVYAAHSDHYARRLVHEEPDLGYTAVAMTWGPGQRTAVHDHDGIWCVECVVHGRMEVVQFDLVETEGSRYRFAEQQTIAANVGSAGCLIPPFEYHVLGNPTAETAVTLHIYGGSMNRCSVFLPRDDGWFERQERTLRYDPA